MYVRFDFVLFSLRALTSINRMKNLNTLAGPFSLGTRNVNTLMLLCHHYHCVISACRAPRRGSAMNNCSERTETNCSLRSDNIFRQFRDLYASPNVFGIIKYSLAQVRVTYSETIWNTALNLISTVSIDLFHREVYFISSPSFYLRYPKIDFLLSF